MNKILCFIFLFFTPLLCLAQEEPSGDLNFMTDILGKKGVMFFIGVIFFAYSYRNSVKFFAWIENQTYGTRDFILKKCELLFFEIEAIKVTYILLFITFGISSIIICVFTLAGEFGLGLFMGGLSAVFFWKIPRPLMNFLVEKRIKKYEGQMVDALNLLSNGLRAGLSVPQSIGMVVDELPAPVSQEFNMILQQTRIGVPLEEAFDNLSKRVPTQDNDMFVSSVNILRETGGNLAEVFDTIAGVIRERLRLKQKIETYVAQGKMQGGVIFSMPFAMGAYFAANDPASMAPLVETWVGRIILVAALVLDLLGGFLILKIVKIKV